MAERTQYTPGTFSWVELSTPDQAAAGRFYSGVFGWELTDTPIGDDQVYTMAALGGRHVGALSPQPRQQREAGVPPLWNSYITVESADDALARAKELGATVHAPAFDVFDAGRMGVVQDPQGAFFMVWEPRGHIGAGVVNTHGALSWNELASPDVDASVTFYGRLFGWTVEPMDMGASTYMVIKNRDGRSNGGIRPAADTEPCYWLVYFGTHDLDASTAEVQQHGGRVVAGPMGFDGGSFAAVQDPEGAVFALYAGHFDD